MRSRWIARRNDIAGDPTKGLEDLPDGRLVLVADDDGEGMSHIDECDEDNNALILENLCGG